MQNTKWYLSKTHIATGVFYNAVKVVGGKTKECDEPPTRYEHIARRRVQTLNNHEALASLVKDTVPPPGENK